MRNSCVLIRFLLISKSIKMEEYSISKEGNIITIKNGFQTLSFFDDPFIVNCNCTDPAIICGDIPEPSEKIIVAGFVTNLPSALVTRYMVLDYRNFEGYSSKDELCTFLESLKAGSISSAPLYFKTIAEAKAETNYTERQTVYIEELGRFYFTTQIADPEDPPLLKIIETASSFKLKRANTILENTLRDQEGIRIRDEVGIGTPEDPKEFITNEGDSTTEDMLVYTFNGSTFSNISEIAASPDGSQFTFPNNSNGNAIYCTLAKTQAGVKYQPHGLKVKMDVAAIYNVAELQWEYWNGLTWRPMTIMSLKDQLPFPSYADKAFQSEGGISEQIRFDLDIEDWADSDPVGLGEDWKWFRIRIQFPLNTLPEFEQFKIHTSRTENAILTEYYGNNRPRQNIGWSLGDLEPAAASPANQDVYLSQTVYSGLKENAFPAGDDRRTGLIKALPRDCDTSSKVRLRFVVSTTNNSGGDVKYIIRTGYTKQGDIVFAGVGGAPTVHPTQVDLEVVGAAPSAQGVQTVYEVDIDVSKLNANPESGEIDADLLWLSFERNGLDTLDTHTGTIYIVDFEANYVKWCADGLAVKNQLETFTIFEDGFETGDFSGGSGNPAWTVVPSANNANTWIVGSDEVANGSFAAYVSNNGSTATYSVSSPDSICHFYRDVVIPADAVVAKVAYSWLCNAEDGPTFDTFDFMKVYAIPATDPVNADVLLNEANRIGRIKYEGETSWQFEELILPASFIGQTVRIVFSFQSDVSIVNNPGGCVDNFRVTYSK